MKSFDGIILMTSCIYLALATSIYAAAPPKSDTGWTDLFDGKTLSGWTQRNGTATYRVEDDTIVGKTANGSPNSFLCTDKTYGDFELVFDVKVDNALNSGVQIRSRTAGGPTGRVNGPQVEIEASGPHGSLSGYVYGEAAGGWMTPDADRKPHPHFKNGQWNRYKVVATGETINTWINDWHISKAVHKERFKAHPSGFIGLQVHGIPAGAGPFEVRWKNIRIKDHSEPANTIRATFKNNEVYRYHTGMGGDEQGASIIRKPAHASMSKMVRDLSTDGEPVYFYKPKAGFVGVDRVALELVDDDVAGNTTHHSIVILEFTVTDSN